MAVIKVAFIFFTILNFNQCKRTGKHRQNINSDLDYKSDEFDEPRLGIVGGKNVTIEDAPYIASLQADGMHNCGGSIIHWQFILTAAHCIRIGIAYTVLVGTDTLDKGGDSYEVEKVYVHKYYSRDTNNNDIALIKLRKAIKPGNKTGNSTNTVAKIPLADRRDILKPGLPALVSGWGCLQEKGNESNILQQVTVPLVDKKECRELYQARELESLSTPITNEMICAGAEGQDACQGDSGGPLVANNKLIGIVSFGIGCGSYPGVYTKVSAYKFWISHVIGGDLSRVIREDYTHRCLDCPHRYINSNSYIIFI